MNPSHVWVEVKLLQMLTTRQRRDANGMNPKNRLRFNPKKADIKRFRQMDTIVLKTKSNIDRGMDHYRQP